MLPNHLLGSSSSLLKQTHNQIVTRSIINSVFWLIPKYTHYHTQYFNTSHVQALALNYLNQPTWIHNSHPEDWSVNGLFVRFTVDVIYLMPLILSPFISLCYICHPLVLPTWALIKVLLPLSLHLIVSLFILICKCRGQIVELITSWHVRRFHEIMVFHDIE